MSGVCDILCTHKVNEYTCTCICVCICKNLVRKRFRDFTSPYVIPLTDITFSSASSIGTIYTDVRMNA